MTAALHDWWRRAACWLGWHDYWPLDVRGRDGRGLVPRELLAECRRCGTMTILHDEGA